jgi:exoribonuclease R
MIPSDLSINAISLKENNIKRAFSVILNLNNEYDIIDVHYEKTFINVRKNMSYEECQQIVENNSNVNITDMYNIGLHLKNKLIHSFGPTEIYDTHQMVAVYMIYANKLVAEKIASVYPDHVLLRSSPFIICDKDITDLTFNKNNNLTKIHNAISKERAYYKMGITNSRHNGLNLELYTHFTSPIRRYADILVHRQLWKVLNNIEVKPISVKTLFLMNSYSKIYKQIERYSHQINIINSPEFIDIDNIELDAHIIFINSDNNIKLYIDKMDIVYDFTIMHNKLKHLVSTNIEENVLTIKNIYTEKKEEITLKLFDQVKVKVSISRNSMNKLNVVIVSPDIYALCL